MNKLKKWTKVTNKVSEWIENYVHDNKIKSLVVGVSGGLDSAVVSYLCAMTGVKLYVVSMPIHQPQSHLIRATNHIKWLKERFTNVEEIYVDLTEAFDVLDGQLTTMLRHTNELCSANTRSRLRMTTLYHLASDVRGIVVGTGNKVEDFGIGFFTKYGDGGVDISPIAGFMKSEVKEMAIAGRLLDEIINAIPSDGLWEGDRTDENQIGASYDELEWAMNTMESYPVDENIEKFEKSLTERQVKVLEIYNSFNTKNKHKMLPIPVFDVSTL
jgi:NAD+ synthase